MIGAFDIMHNLRTFARDDRGASMVEFALIFVVFLIVMFALVDFGRMAYHYVTANKAMQIAARIATVRPPVCPGVPTIYQRDNLNSPANFGTSCTADANGDGTPDGDICLDRGTDSCSGADVALIDGDGNATTAGEIWTRIGGLLPGNATVENLRFNYEYDARLGFLGGPYRPIVSVELENLQFNFIHPLSGLIEMTGATATVGDENPLLYPSMSVSHPGEDLRQGTNG